MERRLHGGNIYNLGAQYAEHEDERSRYFLEESFFLKKNMGK